jgi:hypothetical protein
MPVRYMSYNKAEEIITLYASLLENNEFRTPKYSKYAYRELKGYDSIDILNAMKLDTAYRYFEAGYDADKVLKAKEYASFCDSGIVMFSFFFVPDDVAKALDAIDYTDEKEAFGKSILLTLDDKEFEMNRALRSEELITSFFEFCVLLGNSNSDFWNAVYKRLKIGPDASQKKDRINLCIEYIDPFCRLNSPDSLIEETSTLPAAEQPGKNKELRVSWMRKLFSFTRSNS